MTTVRRRSSEERRYRGTPRNPRNARNSLGVLFAIAGAAVQRTLEAKVIGNKQLASRIAAAVAVASLVGASAFAESRPSNETRGRIRDRVVERNGGSDRSQRGDVSRNRGRTAESSIRYAQKIHIRSEIGDWVCFITEST